MAEAYLTPASLSFRNNLAQLVSPLRRVRPRVPFFRLPAHRIPTLWGLYRNLLRNAPTENIKWRIRLMVRQARGTTSTTKTIQQLKRGYKWLDIFQRARAGDDHLKAVLERYSRMIHAKQQNAYFLQLLNKELEFQDRLRRRPILTGAFLRPTMYHGPLPRLKPQPHHITVLIVKRKKARVRRQERQLQRLEDLRDLSAEHEFEKGLMRLSGGALEPYFGTREDLNEWTAPIKEELSEMSKAFERERIRSSTPCPPDLAASIIQARKSKILNKTHEKERERRGEILHSTIERQKKGPDAHTLTFMSPEKRHLDKVSRSISEVGYVGMAKKALGFKMKIPQFAENLELGKEENRPILDEAAHLVRREMERRQILDENSS